MTSYRQKCACAIFAIFRQLARGLLRAPFEPPFCPTDSTGLCRHENDFSCRHNRLIIRERETVVLRHGLIRFRLHLRCGHVRRLARCIRVISFAHFSQESVDVIHLVHLGEMLRQCRRIFHLQQLLALTLLSARRRFLLLRFRDNLFRFTCHFQSLLIVHELLAHISYSSSLAPTWCR